MTRFLLLAAVIAGGTSRAHAQHASADGDQRDTLRYREVAHTELQMYTPSGAKLMDLKRDARIALVPGAGDTVHAWYEDLALEVQSPQGVRQPNTASLLHQRFLLRRDDRGRITTLQAPAVPDEVREFEDPSQQFTDFFPRLPAAALAPGLEWTDSLKHEVPNQDRSYRRYTVVTSYRVEKDSVAEGARVWVVSTSGFIWLETADMARGRTIQSVSALSGAEAGRLLIDAGSRALVGRTRKGELNGRLTLTGPGAPAARDQIYWFESTITPATADVAASAANSREEQ